MAGSNSSSMFAVRLLLVALAAAILIALIAQYNRNQAHKERFAPVQTAGTGGDVKHVPNLTQVGEPPRRDGGGAPAPNDPSSNYKEVDFATSTPPGLAGAALNTNDRLKAEDLLPKDAANLKWAQVNPAGQGDLKDQNFLTAGYHMGINTQGQSMRNPNLQLRSEVPNPKANVSIWNQSTIDADTSHRKFELGDA